MTSVSKLELSRNKALERYYRNREAIRLKRNAFNKAHPEIVRAAKTKYRRKYPERYRAAFKQWYKGNISKIRVRDRKRYARRSPERVLKQKEYAKKWRQNNREKCRAYERARENRERAVLVDPAVIQRWTIEVRSKPFARCYWCGTKVSGRSIHFDHIIAIKLGGAHSISNLCCSCSDCNRSKGARAISDWLVSGQSFLPL